jgi:aspartate/methionine/tyrosine aminotransferase
MANPQWAGRFPTNAIIGLLDNFPRHNLGESTSQDLVLGELLDLIGLDEIRDLPLGYVSAAGTAGLRGQISALSGAPATSILTTQGVGLALFLLAFEHCRAGDEAVVLTPCFPPSRDALVGAGVRVISAPLAFDHGYRVDVDAVAACLSPRTTLVSLASPQNPSGIRVRESEVSHLLQAMSERAPRALLLIDEIYRDATYGEASTPDSFATFDPRVITTGSISKAHGAPGLRVGWLTAADPDLLARLTVAKMNITLSSSALDEALAERVLAHRDEILAPRRAFLATALHLLGEWHTTQAHRLDWVQPEGGAMCCLRLRPDQFDDDAVARFWQRLPHDQIQLGSGVWFGESARVFRLGFGYLPLPHFHLALEQLSSTLNHVSR